MTSRAPSSHDICVRYATPARFHYLDLAGHNRTDEFEDVLREAGHAVVVVETCGARAAAAPEARTALAKGEIAAALHYSRRSAEIFVRLAGDAGVVETLGRIPHLARFGAI
jgi:uroporphyrinogen-III synthase